MTLTARDIAEITRLLEDSSFDELELEVDGLKIHLRRGNGVTPHSPAKAAAPPPAAIGPAAISAKAAGGPLEPGVEPVRAPLLGTFYRAPKPGAPPFVDAGARVEPDTIIGIIEVMKLMNTVRAGVRGAVCDIRARDGTLVEYGETLMTVDTRSAR